VQCGNRGGTALRLDASQENGATLAPQLLQERNGVLQHESEVRVLVQAFIVDQLDLDQLNPWQVRVTNPAKGHDRVHARGVRAAP